jgi:hypothetical protein
MLDLFFVDQFSLAEFLCEQFGTDIVADNVALMASQLFKVFSRPHDYFGQLQLQNNKSVCCFVAFKKHFLPAVEVCLRQSTSPL